MLRRCTYNVTNIQWQNSRDWSLGFVSLLKPWVWISLMSLLYQCKLSCERLEPKISAVPLRLRMKSSTFIFLSARTLLLWRSVLSIMIAKARRNTVSGARRCLRTVGLHAQYRSENAYNTNPAVGTAHGSNNDKTTPTPWSRVRRAVDSRQKQSVMWSETVGLRTRPVWDQKIRSWSWPWSCTSGVVLWSTILSRSSS